MATTTVVITEAPIGGLAAWNDGPTVLGRPTLFVATVVSGTNVEYVWDLGDGGRGEGAEVTHTYGAAGRYTATVEASNRVSRAEAETVVLVVQPTWRIYLPLVLRSP